MFIIDKSGNQINKLNTFDDARYFNDDLAMLKKNNKYGHIDKTGKVVFLLSMMMLLVLAMAWRL